VDAGPFHVDVPVFASIDPLAFVLASAAMLATFRYQVGMVPLLIGTSSAGLVLFLAGLIG
jgi:chromate transporter